MPITLVKPLEDLYLCYKHKPTIITTFITSKQLEALSKESPYLNEDGQLTYNCYLVRSCKDARASSKGKTQVFVLDKRAKSHYSYSDFEHLIQDKRSLFTPNAWSLFTDLCKRWANPVKWQEELEYLEEIGTLITHEHIQKMYVTQNIDVLRYIGEGRGNYELLWRLDSNTLWYLFITRNMLEECTGMTSRALNYFELLREQVMLGNVSIKVALMRVEYFINSNNILI